MVRATDGQRGRTARPAVAVAECCPCPTTGPLEGDEARRIAAVLGVLADPARLRILSLLSAVPSGAVCVTELTGALDLSQPTVSHHLRVLHEAGLVEREPRGHWAYYRLRPEIVELLGRIVSFPWLRVAGGPMEERAP